MESRPLQTERIWFLDALKTSLQSSGTTPHLSADGTSLLTDKEVIYRYFKLRKAFSKFYRRHSALLEKYSVSLKTLLQQGISEPEFYGDLVYRFRKNVGKSNFSEQFRKPINRYKRIGYSLDIMRQTACLVVNPIIVDGYASLFNCTTAVRASDSMTISS